MVEKNPKIYNLVEYAKKYKGSKRLPPWLIKYLKY